MATVAVLPPSDLSFEHAMETLELWAQAEPTDEEILEFLKTAIKDLGEPGNIEIFRAAMKELGERGAKISEAFDRVKKTMDTFVAKNGSNFPGLKAFQNEWNGYNSEWNFLINTSRDFVLKTCVEYVMYTMPLEFFGMIQTKEQLNLVANILREFAKNKPDGIPTDFQERFLELRKQVGGEEGFQGFQERFNKYLDTQGGVLEDKAKALNADIITLKAEIAGLDAQVKAATLALKIASWWGPLGTAIAGTTLAIFCKKRVNKQKELDAKNDEMKGLEALQTELGKIRAQFAVLVPEFDLLCKVLNLFATTWTAFHVEAGDFAEKFKELETPTKVPAILKGRIDLALKVAEPLSLGLKDYASAIH